MSFALPVQIIRLIRVRQWYKNLLIFLPILFVGMLFDKEMFFLTVLGFFSLSFLSSGNYVLNDLLDVKRDRAHPEKKHRPIASGAIGTPLALFLVVVLYAASFAIGYQFSTGFVVILGILFGSTLAYSLGLKNEPFLDLLLISLNFILRAISGAFVLNVSISPWLIL